METREIFWTFAVLAVAGVLLVFASGFAGASDTPLPPGNMATLSASNAQYAASTPSATASSPAATAPSSGSVQEITLTVQGGQYLPYPIKVKKGAPVRITVDTSSVAGCARNIVMPDFGVNKFITQSDNAIEFTPTQSGTFGFSCSMGMYQGKIVVEEADGSVASFTGSAPKAASGSCGMAKGGGCGCGGARQ